MSSSSSSQPPPLRRSGNVTRSGGSYPRFLTFRPGEREALLERHVRKHLGIPNGAPLPPFAVPYGPAQPGGGRAALLKAHAFPVRYPDGTEGACRYERQGPAFHAFRFAYHDGSALPREYWSRPLGNAPVSIEAKGRELAGPCFEAACERERREFFRRATLPAGSGRRVDAARFRMTAARAKELAGKYALCVVTDGGDALIATSGVYESLERAITDWREKGDRRLVVACCSRLDRRWMLPRFNPLYAEFDPRPRPAAAPLSTETAESAGERREA